MSRSFCACVVLDVFLGVLVVTLGVFGSVFLFVYVGSAYAAEIECAEFTDNGDIKTKQETVGNDVTAQTQAFDLNAKEGAEKLKRIQQKSPWTHEKVDIKDGKMQIISTCGEKGKTGTVTICIDTPQGKKCGIKIPKDKEEIIDATLDAASDRNPESAMRKLVLGDRNNWAAKIKNLNLRSSLNISAEDLLKIGVPEQYVGQALSALEKDPEKALALLSASAEGNIQKVKKILDSTDLSYFDTDTLARNATRMYGNPAKVASTLPEDARSEFYSSEYFCGFGTPCPTGDVPPTMRHPITGFNDPSSDEDRRLGDGGLGTAPVSSASIAEKVSPLVDELTGHGCQNNNLSCRTNNPGAMRYANWMQKYDGFSCGQSNDTACFPSVEAGVAAKADLVIRRINQGCNTLYTILEDCRYSSVRDGNDSYAYAVKVGSITGIGAHGKLDSQNAEQMARLLTGMAWYEGGRGIGFNAEQLERGLKAYYGTERLPEGDPNFTPGTSIRSIASGGGLRVGAGQFFENTFGGGSGLFSGYGSSFGGSSMGGFFGNLLSILGFTSSTDQQVLTPPLPPQAIPPPIISEPVIPSLKLTSYPREVKRGEMVVLIWSSAGVAREPSCALHEEGEEGSRTRRASKSFGTFNKEVPLSYSGSVIKFILECAPPDVRISKSDATARLEISVK